jgi:hypothetical protein
MKNSFLWSLLLGCILIAVAWFAKPLWGQQNEAAEPERAGVNLAVVAEPSSSHVSGDTSLTALNDGHQPRASRDRRRGSYGNWNRTGTQWVQYEWAQPKSRCIGGQMGRVSVCRRLPA